MGFKRLSWFPSFETQLIKSVSVLLLFMHYMHSFPCRSFPHEPLGCTLAARRLLVMAGWRVVVVPHHLWLLMASEEEQLMFVYNELAAQGC